MTKKIYTKKEICGSLEAMGAPRESVVIMHSSMRSVGAVEGGVRGLLDVMIDYFATRCGLFLVPTHTWHNLEGPVTLDMTSPDTCLGAFASAAISDGRGLRTENPTHSMVIFGDRERAREFAAGEESVETPTSPCGCYAKLYSHGGKVLLVGVGQTKNTYIHSVEEMLGVPNRMETKPTEYTVRRESGELVRRNVRLFYTDYSEDISYRFYKYELPFRYHGAITDGFIGDAPTQLCDARKIESALRLIYERSAGSDPLADDDMLPPRLYTK